jgi:N utilization substance protein A
MPVRLSDEARRYIKAFEELSGVSARDCLVLDGDGGSDGSDGDDPAPPDSNPSADSDPDLDLDAGPNHGDGDDDGDGRLVFLVAAGKMGQAIGPDGATVERAEDRFGRRIHLVEDADTPAAFVASALAPAAVRHVTISEQDGTVAFVEVDEADRGVAIGADGRNIDVARRLAKRHYGVDDIQLT